MKILPLSKKSMTLAVIITVVIALTVLFQTSIYRATSNAKTINEAGEEYASFTYFEPRIEPIAYLAFYPGGLVEKEAYAPLAYELSLVGIGVYLLEVPLYLAIFQTDAAKNILGVHDDNLPFYVGGHSLGGVAASIFANHYIDQVDGLILLASYPTEDLSESSLEVISIRAEFDHVLNSEAYEEARPLLPDSTTYHTILGGNHGQFGDYGEQTGDGIATIRNDQQWVLTTQLILAWHAAHMEE